MGEARIGHFPPRSCHGARLRQEPALRFGPGGRPAAALDPAALRRRPLHGERRSSSPFVSPPPSTGRSLNTRSGLRHTVPRRNGDRCSTLPGSSEATPQTATRLATDPQAEAIGMYPYIEHPKAESAPLPHRCRTDVHPRRRHRTTRTRHPSSVHTPPTCSPTSASSRQRSPRSPPPARVIGTGPFTPTAEPANRSQRTGSEQTRSMPVCFQTHGRSADTLGDPACSGHLHESVQTRLPATPALDASMQCEFVAPRPELSGAGVDAYANIDGAGGHRADRFVTANGAQRTRTDLGVAGFTELMTFSEEHAVTTRCAPLACQPCAASA